MKKYTVTCSGHGAKMVEAKDSGDAKRKAANLWKSEGKFTGKADTWIHNHDLVVTCQEGESAKAGPPKKVLGKGIATAKAPKEPEKAEPLPASAPSFDIVVGWMLYYVNRGIEYVNKSIQL